jgi:hypothetical protein
LGAIFLEITGPKKPGRSTGSKVKGDGAEPARSGFAIVGNPMAMGSGGMGAAGSAGLRAGARFVAMNSVRASGTLLLLLTPSNFAANDPCKYGSLCAYDPATGTMTQLAYAKLMDQQRMKAAAADQGNDSEEAAGANEAEPEREKTPSTDPDNFEPVRGTKGKKDKETGEIWEKDRLHKDHREVYGDKRDYEKGKRDRDVWDDGRPKRKF